MESETGINILFKRFTMYPETTEKLRGKGHESTDLHKIVSTYKQWHLEHAPKLEYYNFLDKVKKMNKKEVPDYV